MSIPSSRPGDLEGLRAVYDDVQVLRMRLEQAKTLERVSADYQRAVGDLDRALTALRGRRDELAARVAPANELSHEEIDAFAPILTKTRARTTPWSRTQGVPGVRSISQDPDLPSRSSLLARRRKLKRAINRWARTWGLDDEALATVNRVADDADRPLGEALAVLAWHVFAEPLGNERPEAHRARLDEWRDVLVEYRERLAEEADALETQFRDWTAMWKLWKAREASESGRRAWERALAEARRAKCDEADRITAEIRSLEAAHDTGAPEP